LKKIDEKALKHFVSRWHSGFLFGQKRTHKKQKAKSKKQNRLSQTPKSVSSHGIVATGNQAATPPMNLSMVAVLQSVEI
jgi:hypothetical protein